MMVTRRLRDPSAVVAVDSSVLPPGTGWIPGARACDAPALAAPPPRPTLPPRIPSAPECQGCFSEFSEHDIDCNAIGAPGCRVGFRLSQNVAVMLCPNLEDTSMNPSIGARACSKDFRQAGPLAHRLDAQRPAQRQGTRLGDGIQR